MVSPSVFLERNVRRQYRSGVSAWPGRVVRRSRTCQSTSAIRYYWALFAPMVLPEHCNHPAGCSGIRPALSRVRLVLWGLGILRPPVAPSGRRVPVVRDDTEPQSPGPVATDPCRWDDTAGQANCIHPETVASGSGFSCSPSRAGRQDRRGVPEKPGERTVLSGMRTAAVSTLVELRVWGQSAGAKSIGWRQLHGCLLRGPWQRICVALSAGHGKWSMLMPGIRESPR